MLTLGEARPSPLTFVLAKAGRKIWPPPKPKGLLGRRGLVLTTGEDRVLLLTFVLAEAGRRIVTPSQPKGESGSRCQNLKGELVRRCRLPESTPKGNPKGNLQTDLNTGATHLWNILAGATDCWIFLAAVTSRQTAHQKENDEKGLC